MRLIVEEIEKCDHPIVIKVIHYENIIMGTTFYLSWIYRPQTTIISSSKDLQHFSLFKD